jgi:tRNA nucleotidyltransferase (CCA-adding enzyme)
MRLILTHEQADFDALASLLGAHLLDEEAIPVLPMRQNRNLRAFLTLYGSALPFTDRRDLPPQPVTSITLVDTQSIVTVKGMQPDTPVQVIDHHPPRADLPPSWQISAGETGANTTLFVEGMQERGIQPDSIQATLLLLGIYEDTGSLTYSRTTPRDLQAAAYLIEHGAKLDIANDFLNHPLSLAQEKLYQRLQQEADTLLIHGHTIIITQGDAQNLDEELSTIAHKMRNVLEPDALFLLLQTRGGVQMIARSTDDHIDVAEVASHFGGGGHARAAAALIKNQDLAQVRHNLQIYLQDIVRPAITVAEIMSRGPQLLAIDTPVQEAASRMQRYGYEGYPVVENGSLVGLLTRRSVDRAIAHKLNLTAGSLMQAGKVTVFPSDSIEQLQNIMTETGWGQVPVVHPESGEIIGIVTRTDLLKILSSQNQHGERQNLEGKLESGLPPARLALLKTVAQAAHEMHAALYIVGGFVRDLLMGQPSLDLDLVVEGDAIALAKFLQEQFGGRLTSHSQFGTAKWHIEKIQKSLSKRLEESYGPDIKAKELPKFIDLITARTEFYTYPSALPTVERGSIKLDLHRRDFTINTLALRLDGSHYGELHDYWGGLHDLNQGILRVLHSLSFVDDPTRMLRAVRYEQRYQFQIEPRTLQLLREARSLLGRVSGERLRHEFDHIIDEKARNAMMARLHDLALLAQIHKDLTWDSWLSECFERLRNRLEWEIPPLPRNYPLERALAYAIWLIRLPDASVQAVLEALVYPHSLGDQFLAAAELWRVLPDLPGKKPSEVARILDPMPPLALYAAFLAVDDSTQKALLKRYNSEWRELRPITTGHDLRQRGLPPGPQYQRVLDQLRNAWLDDEIHTQEEELRYLENLLSQQ